MVLPWAANSFLILTCYFSLALGIYPPTGNSSSHVPRLFELNITWEDFAPDGFVRKQFLINGQFPGPELVFTEGDEVHVLVHNESPYNTTIHFHGLEMLYTPWSDGVPGVSQRFIQPGNSFLYAFNTTQYGSYWYHSHTSNQIDDGLYGPITIRPRSTTRTPFHLIPPSSYSPTSTDESAAMAAAARSSAPLLLSDWQHLTSNERWNLSLASGIETPCYDALLFNGRGAVHCLPSRQIIAATGPDQAAFLDRAGGANLTAKGCLPAVAIGDVLAAGFQTNLSVIPPGVFDTCTDTNGSQLVLEYAAAPCANYSAAATHTWIALDVIGTFSLMTVSFSIDRTPLWVYAVDGSFITPQKVDAVRVTNGDRFSVLARLDTPGTFPMRMASTTTAQTIIAEAVLRYSVPGQATPPANSTSALTLRGAGTSSDVVFFQQSAMKAFPPTQPAPVADQTVVMHMRVAGQAYEWALNQTVYSAMLDAAAPPLLFAPDPKRANNVTITTRNNTWVDLVFVTAKIPMPAHPIHKHSNKMYLLGQGTGEWKWNTVQEAAAEMPDAFNLVDPPHRDTIATLEALTEPTWMAVRYHVVNPGAWLVHCHIETHLKGGMAAVIQDGIDAWPTVPEEYVEYV
ncbi:hypothetical protein TD95_002790 [Thielaviopsis punctulata]|uniref:Laccase n=1 Tax=Thielaviopsis punctulata TaxID=72032 RepID=A0A0F4ZGT1_9PEZI|nr:hypothetical protein TD95_002790 [Thielaviopsis punctulata]